jgi:hypothetical protein
MPLFHDRRPERPQQAGEDRKASRDVKKDVRKDDTKEVKAIRDWADKRRKDGR